MAIGEYRHRVTVQRPGAPVPDGDGGYVTGWADAAPAQWHCRIDPATARDLERVTAGTVIATASHIVTGRYHAGVTTDARLVFGTRVFQVTGVSSPDERQIDTVAVCVELVDAVPFVDTGWTQGGWMQ